MKDRLISGSLAGAIAGLIQNLFGQTLKALGITDRAFADFAKVLIMYKPYQGTLAIIVGVISHIITGLIFGVIFAYIIQKTSSKYLLTKGIAYGAVLWVLLSGFGTMFKLPMFFDIPPRAALTTFVGALIYGFVTAYALKFIDNRTKLL